MEFVTDSSFSTIFIDSLKTYS